ncbi:hypothetical protein [Flagellimonas sp. 2504JD1-5]
MKRIFYVFLFMVSCEADPVNFEGDIISSIDIDKSSLVADGTDNTNIKVNFNKEVDVSRIKLQVKVNNGVFSESDSQTIELTPIADLEKAISAEFTLKSTTSNVDHELEFKIDPYITNRKITSVKSEPHSIKLVADSFKVGTNFSSEIKLEATILNESRKNVSSGAKVKITDLFENGNPANGLFREENLSTKSDSKISAIYSPGFISANQKIILTVDVIDENENELGISDTIEVTVIDEN